MYEYDWERATRRGIIRRMKPSKWYPHRHHMTTTRHLGSAPFLGSAEKSAVGKGSLCLCKKETLYGRLFYGYKAAAEAEQQQQQPSSRGRRGMRRRPTQPTNHPNEMRMRWWCVWLGFFCMPCIYFYKDPLGSRRRRVEEWICSGWCSSIRISTVICGCMFPLCNNNSSSQQISMNRECISIFCYAAGGALCTFNYCREICYLRCEIKLAGSRPRRCFSFFFANIHLGEPRRFLRAAP